jgi:hypothetical protein
MNQMLASHPYLASAAPVGMGIPMPSTQQGIEIAVAIAAVGGFLGWWLGRKLHPLVGATVGAIAGVAVVPVWAGLIGGVK